MGTSETDRYGPEAAGEGADGCGGEAVAARLQPTMPIEAKASTTPCRSRLKSIRIRDISLRSQKLKSYHDIILTDSIWENGERGAG